MKSTTPKPMDLTDDERRLVDLIRLHPRPTLAGEIAATVERSLPPDRRLRLIDPPPLRIVR